MEPTFLSLSEAAQLSNKSPSTIRRVVHSITTAKDHPDRQGIEPNPGEVATFKKKGENFAWKISKEVLEKHLKSALKEEQKMMRKQSGDLPKDVLQILQRELEIKSAQIEKQWEVIGALNERLREGNILMGSLQQRLALPTAESAKSTAQKKASADAPIEASVNSAPKASKKSSKGFFGWLRA